MGAETVPRRPDGRLVTVVTVRTRRRPADASAEGGHTAADRPTGLTVHSGSGSRSPPVLSRRCPLTPPTTHLATGRDSTTVVL